MSSTKSQNTVYTEHRIQCTGVLVQTLKGNPLLAVKYEQGRREPLKKPVLLLVQGVRRCRSICSSAQEQGGCSSYCSCSVRAWCTHITTTTICFLSSCSYSSHLNATAQRYIKLCVPCPEGNWLRWRFSLSSFR